MKEKILLFVHSLSTYDYLYYLGVILLFIFLIILTLLLRKRITLALLTLLIAILEVALAPTVGFEYFHSFLFANSIEVTKAKRLEFVQAVVIEGSLQNESKFDFSSCTLSVKISKDKHNKIKNLILKLKPIKTKTFTLKDIARGEKREFKFLIEPFTYKKDFLVSVSGICK